MEHLPVSIKVGSSMRLCGFCTWPTHGQDRHPLDSRLDTTEISHCPVGILTGDGITVIKCQCPCSVNLIKCFDCNRTQRADDEDGDIDPVIWRCKDRDECQAFRTKRLEANPTIQLTREARTRATETVRKERVAKAPARPNAGKCLHCGEPTKGGLFLPGHDSTFLAAAARDVNERKRTLEEVTMAWAQLGVSEALQGKLAKRVTK